MPTLSTGRLYGAQALHCTKMTLPACFSMLYSFAELVVSLCVDKSACSASTFLRMTESSPQSYRVAQRSAGAGP